MACRINNKITKIYTNGKINITIHINNRWFHDTSKPMINLNFILHHNLYISCEHALKTTSDKEWAL